MERDATESWSKVNEPLKVRARRLREGKGFTQDELSKRAGVSPTHVYQIERGLRKRMHLDTLTRYAKALDVSPQYLDVGYDEAPHGAQEWPSIPVTLRHTTDLNEQQIDQVTRFIQALEAQQRLEQIIRENEDAEKARSQEKTG